MEQERPFYTVSEIAEKLGVTPNRTYQMIATGELPSVRIGGGIRVPVASWEQWIKNKNDEALKNVRK
jgi:excisionase family DNA binding protein